MTQAYQVKIITVYSATQTTGARFRLRLLALLSLLVAVAWLGTVHLRVEPWLKQKLILAGLNEVGALLLSAPADQQMTPEQRTELRAQAAASERRAAILAGSLYAWLGFAYLAGGWLALASLLGLLGRRVSVRMLRQAAVLIIFSTLLSIAGIWSAIKWGGMPPQADAQYYAKLGAIQSSYAWFLLLATRFVR